MGWFPTSWPSMISRTAQAYALRRRRRRLLWRSWRSRRALQPLQDLTSRIQSEDILCVVCLRNESARLPAFLSHHRTMGVNHFLIVDNASTDSSLDLLLNQPDISVWQSRDSYRQARFGVDWTGWLLARYGHGHWCLTLDVDEMLVYPYHQTRKLRALTGWLDQQGQESMGAMMLDLYPQGRISTTAFENGDDPLQLLTHFDAGNYCITKRPGSDHLWIQGGPRARVIFAQNPARAPTLNKVPLIRWNRRYVYVNSTHNALPPRLNHIYGQDGTEKLSGILLHSKFLPQILDKSCEDLQRKEHFNQPDLYQDYYNQLISDPIFYHRSSTHLTGWRQLEALGLMSRGGWI